MICPQCDNQAIMLTVQPDGALLMVCDTCRAKWTGKLFIQRVVWGTAVVSGFLSDTPIL